MANNNIIEKTNNLDKTIPVEPIGYLYTNETQAHQFIISCTRKGEKVRLTGSVSARFVTSQNTYFVVRGSIVNGNAVITLHQDCYSIPGHFDLAIFVTSGTETTVVYAAVGTVKRTDSEEGVITGEPLPTLDELLAVVRDAQRIVSDFDDIILVQDTQPTSETNRIWVQPQANEYQVPTYEEFEDLKDSIALTFDASTNYAAGAVVYHDGTLYKFTQAHSAGSWTGTDAVQVVLANDVSTLNTAVAGISNVFSYIQQDITDLNTDVQAVTDQENLFDVSDPDVADGKRLNTSGTLNSHDDCFTSGFIPVVPGMKYKTNAMISDIQHRIAIYGANKAFISGEIYEVNIVQIPSNGAFIRFCGLLSEKSTATVHLMTAYDYKLREHVAETDESFEGLSNDYKNNFYSVTNDQQKWNKFDVIFNKVCYCDGTIETKQNYCYIDIPVEEGKTYRFNSIDPTSETGIKTGTAHYICPITSGGEYYFSTKDAETWKANYTIPTEASITHMIVSIPVSRLDENGNYSITTEVLSANNKYTPRIETVTGQIADKITLSNLLDGTEWENGWVSATSGAVTQNDSYRTSGFMPVTSGKYIVSCKNNSRCEIFSLAVYDENNNVIAGDGVQGDGHQRLTGFFVIPEWSAYVKVTYRLATFGNDIILYQYDYNVGYNSSDFYIIKERALIPVYDAMSKIVVPSDNPWAGKVMASYGDSQTNQYKWQPLVAEKLGMTSIKFAVSGASVAIRSSNTGDCLASTYNLGRLKSECLDGNDFDVLLFMGGTNDWGYDGVIHPDHRNILIGTNEDSTEDSTKNTTFKGALKSIVKWFQETYPTKTIVLMSNIGGRAVQENGGEIITNLTEPLANANGYTQATFAQATKEVAEYLGIPFIDVYSCGITIYNTATYIEDGLHINSTTGAKKVANAVINGLKKIQPYCE